MTEIFSFDIRTCSYGERKGRFDQLTPILLLDLIEVLHTGNYRNVLKVVCLPDMQLMNVCDNANVSDFLSAAIWASMFSRHVVAKCQKYTQQVMPEYTRICHTTAAV